MKTLAKLNLFLILVLLLAACAPVAPPVDTPPEASATESAPVEGAVTEEPATAPPSPLVAAGADLAGTSWTLSALAGELALPGIPVTLEFGADGSVSGTDGCNRFTTTYTQDGASLTINQPMASTMMLCEESVMQQAGAYGLALAATTGFLGGGQQLVLTDGSDFVATFVAGVETGEAAVEAPVAESTLANTNWNLASLVGAPPLEGVSVFLQFGADGTVSGSDGCNNFSTTYTEDGANLTIAQPVASTMMACEQPIMDQAAAFMAALAATNTFDTSTGELALSDGATVLTTLAAAPSDLTDSAWDVVNYNNGREAVVSILADTEITAYFGADGTVSGNAGCNQYFAEYTTSNNTIAIGQPGSTMMFCGEPEGVMEQESEFLAALQSAATYSVRGDMLEMRTAADQLALVMTRRQMVDLPDPAPEPKTPTGVVTGAQALNIRTGPGTNFPVIGVARNGDTGEIVGRSDNGRWWVVAIPSAAGGTGWASADFITATNAEDVPVIASPPPPPTATPRPPTPTPLPRPTATPVPLATPSAEIAFWVNRNTIEQGQCTTLNWSVQNVQAVWVYPQGETYNRFPRAGQGNEIVCPPHTTTYEMRVQMRDGSTQFRQVTVNVNPAPPPAPTNPLSGSRWDVVNYNDGNALTTLIGGTRINMNFGADGQVTGNAGCNNYFALYSVTGSNLTVGQPGATSLFCTDPAGVMDQEARFLSALQSAGSFRINGNQLEITSRGGQLVIVAARTP